METIFKIWLPNFPFKFIEHISFDFNCLSRVFDKHKKAECKLGTTWKFVIYFFITCASKKVLRTYFGIILRFCIDN